MITCIKIFFSRVPSMFLSTFVKKFCPLTNFEADGSLIFTTTKLFQFEELEYVIHIKYDVIFI